MGFSVVMHQFQGPSYLVKLRFTLNLSTKTGPREKVTRKVVNLARLSYLLAPSSNLDIRLG